MQKNRLRFLCFLLLSFPLPFILLTPSTARAAMLANTQGKAGDGWQIISSPSPGNKDNNLAAIAAVSASNVWAVGSFQDVGEPARTLIEHWNGTTWSIVPSPNASTNYNALLGVAALSANDVWAVGFFYTSDTNIPQTLIEHWNGTAWSVVATPPSDYAALESVAALSANDVWAVGNHPVGERILALTEHWNGKVWSIVPTPSTGAPEDFLIGITALSAHNIWTVGYSILSGTTPVSLIEHWNGRNWQRVSSTDLKGSNFNGVAALSSHSIWAMGTYNNGDDSQTTLAEHWNGKSWSVVPGPEVVSTISYFVGVVATSSKEAWAVGGFLSQQQTFLPLIEHWNGRQWSVSSTPDPGPGGGVLSAMTKVPTRNIVWTVGVHLGYGSIGPSSIPQTLIEVKE